MPTEPKHFVSIGHLCEHLQVGYFEMLRLLTDRGVHPSMTLNLIPYFDFERACHALEQAPPMIQEGTDHAD